MKRRSTHSPNVSRNVRRNVHYISLSPSRSRCTNAHGDVQQPAPSLIPPSPTPPSPAPASRMTSEMKQALADPNVAIQIAVGDPIPALVPQDPSVGLKFGGVYAKVPRRFILKSGKLSRDDQRVFDAHSKRLVMNSHHPGKNPYGALDPLGLGNGDDAYQRASMGAEWESLTDVTGHGHGFPSFQIRPKKLSRQYV